MNENIKNKPQLITKISSYDVITDVNQGICVLPIIIIGCVYSILSLFL